MIYNKCYLKGCDKVMPPIQRITAEKIINSAFEILKEKGIDSINARAIGKALNCSTQPIFSQFKTMEELKAKLIRKARDLYNEYIKEALLKEKPFKASGLAYINFAKDEPQLFKLLFMNDNKNSTPSPNEFDENHNEVLNKAMSSTGFSSDDSEKIYFYLWIFVHGVATMIATNTVKFTDEQIDDLLTTSYLAMKDRINKENKED